MDYPLLLKLHFWAAILFLISYTLKAALFLSGNREKYLSYKKKTLVVETLLSVAFLVFGGLLLYFDIKWDRYQHWLDPKITLALLAIPLGIVGFKKESKPMVAVSLLFFIVALIIGLAHYH